MKNGFAKLLEKSKTTIYRISEETGVPMTTLYEWRNGEHTPRTESIAKVAKFFDVTIEELL